MPIELSGSEGSARHTLARDDEVVLRLSENPTTGYRWQVTQSGAGELGLVDDRFVGGPEAPLPGGGGQRILRFTARRAGEVRVEAVLRREWDPPEVSQEKRSFVVVVR